MTSWEVLPPDGRHPSASRYWLADSAVTSNIQLTGRKPVGSLTSWEVLPPAGRHPSASRYRFAVRLQTATPAKHARMRHPCLNRAARPSMAVRFTRLVFIRLTSRRKSLAAKSHFRPNKFSDSYFVLILKSGVAGPSLRIEVSSERARMNRAEGHGWPGRRFRAGMPG